MQDGPVGDGSLILPSLEAGMTISKPHHRPPTMVGPRDVEKGSTFSHRGDKSGKANAVSVDIQKRENLTGIHAGQVA